MVLPMSTFAMAAGVAWDVLEVVSKDTALQRRTETRSNAKIDSRCDHDPYPCHVRRGDAGPVIPTRLAGPKKLLEEVARDWSAYLPACLEAARELLGPHPFQRLDVVILPRCFSGLGLASPNLIFVSQSLVLNGDGGMVV